MSAYALYYTNDYTFAIDTFFIDSILIPAPKIVSGMIHDKDADIHIPIISLSKSMGELASLEKEDVLVFCTNPNNSAVKKVGISVMGMIDKMLIPQDEEITQTNGELVTQVINTQEYGKVLILDVEKILA